MTEATRARIFEYLEDKIETKYLEQDVNNLCAIIEQESYIGKQKEFNEFYIIKNSEEINIENLKHRISLIFEELSEIVENSGKEVQAHYIELMAYKEIDIKLKMEDKVNVVEILDGLVDLQYVLSGSVVALNFEKVFDEAYLEVHRNNMMKTHNSYPEVAKFIKTYYPGTNEAVIEIIPVEGKYILKIKNKIIKPKDHPKVKLEKFLKHD